MFYTILTSFLQVINYERDINKAKQGDTEDLAYKKIAGFNEDFTGTADKPDILQYDDLSEGSSGSESDEEDDDDESGLFIADFTFLEL